MNILVVGNADSHAEFNSKFGSKHSVNYKTCENLNSEDITTADFVFDFEVSPHSSHAQLYCGYPEPLLFLNSAKTTLAALVQSHQWKNSLIGFNGLPGMFNHPIIELTSLEEGQERINEVCATLDTDYRLVEDRIGMVTPRVVCMIINEAYYTVEEGTAVVQDIDLAMKLGTNYPAGPFEMARTIGVGHICQLLEALYIETGDERYKISPLLKQQVRETD